MGGKTITTQRFTLDTFLQYGIQKLSRILKKEPRQIINEALIDYLKNPIDKYYTRPSHKYKKTITLDVHIVNSIEKLAKERNVTPLLIVRTAITLYITKYLKEIEEERTASSSTTKHVVNFLALSRLTRGN